MNIKEFQDYCRINYSLCAEIYDDNEIWVSDYFCNSYLGTRKIQIRGYETDNERVLYKGKLIKDDNIDDIIVKMYPDII